MTDLRRGRQDGAGINGAVAADADVPYSEGHAKGPFSGRFVLGVECPVEVNVRHQRISRVMLPTHSHIFDTLFPIIRVPPTSNFKRAAL